MELTWKLKEKDVESKVQLDKLRIETLQEKIAAQTQEIEKLKSQATAANEMVKEIATSAIEGASGTRALQSINEIALEQAKAKTASK